MRRIEKIKERYKVKNTVVVADRGLHSTDNLKMLLDNGYGFIVAQKVSNLSDEIKTLMFDDSGYSALKDIPFEKRVSNIMNITIVMMKNIYKKRGYCYGTSTSELFFWCIDASDDVSGHRSGGQADIYG